MKLTLPVRLFRLAVCGLVFAVSSASFAQNAGRDNSTTREGDKPAQTGSRDPSYRLRTSDTVSVNVVGQADFSTQQRIDNRGIIRMWLLDEVVLAGKTVREAEAFLEQSLVDKKLLKHPHVLINVHDYKPREIFLSGFINNPGVFVLPGDEPSIELKKLVMARGGLQPKAAGGRVQVTRSGQSQSQSVDVDAILKGKGPDSFLIFPGDTIHVPPKWF